MPSEGSLAAEVGLVFQPDGAGPGSPAREWVRTLIRRGPGSHTTETTRVRSPDRKTPDLPGLRRSKVEQGRST